MGGYGISLLHLSYFYYLYLSLLAKMRAVEQRNNLISAPKPQQEIFLIYLKLSYEIISVVFIKLFKISFPKPHPLSRKLYNQELLSFTQMLGDSLFFHQEIFRQSKYSICSIASLFRHQYYEEKQHIQFSILVQSIMFILWSFNFFFKCLNIIMLLMFKFLTCGKTNPKNYSNFFPQ